MKVRAGVVPAGGGRLGVAEWLEVVERDYLRDFIPEGGAAVKVAVVGGEDVATRLRDGLAAAAERSNVVIVDIDAAETRIHFVDQLYAAVARTLDWQAIAARLTRDAYAAEAFPVDIDELDVDSVADRYGIDAGELYRSARRRLEQMILGDVLLPRDLRVALLRLCQACLAYPPGGTGAALTASATAWLQAETVPAAQLRATGISGRIARNTARGLLASLGHLLARAGYSGLVLMIDCERLGVARRPPLELRQGFYYTRAAVLDAYEVLRQLVDTTDAMEATFAVVLLPPELVSDESRGLRAYDALALRVADEVRDRRRANPYAPLVRLETRLEAVR